MQFQPSRRHLLGLVAASSAAVLLTACGGDGAPVFNPPAAGQKYSQIVVVGASISDTGNACALSAANCPPSPPYATGVYSNGTLWIQTVAANYKLAVMPSLKGGTNYAYGGARTGDVPSPIAGAPALTGSVPSMAKQTETYFNATSLRADPNALYVVDATTFGNNFNAAATAFATAAAAGQVPATEQTAYFTKVTTAAVTDIVGIVNKLYAGGARQVLVVNVPNLGVTPLLTKNGAAPVAINPIAAAGQQLSGGFNQNLAAQFGVFASSWSGMNLKTFDTFSLNTQAAQNPASLGFTNGTAACFLPPTATPAFAGSMCATPGTYFYWDGLHPTAATGKLFSERVIAQLGN